MIICCILAETCIHVTPFYCICPLYHNKTYVGGMLWWLKLYETRALGQFDSQFFKGERAGLRDSRVVVRLFTLFSWICSVESN